MKVLQNFHPAAAGANRRRMLFSILMLLLLGASTLWAQVDFDALNASESFREGVVSFHRGRYNEAILAFQRSLSFVSDDNLTREWLGRALYFSGFEDAALNEWERIESAGEASPSLRAFIDHVRSRQSLAGELGEDRDYLILEEFEADEYQNSMLHPGGIVPDGTGRSYVTSFSGNSIQLLDQSGRILDTLIGGLFPLSGPYDLDLYEDEIYVSNFLSDTISVLDLQGNTVRRFGSTGIGDEQLIGPQYVSIAPEPALYVSDFGNQRIVKYDLEGNLLFHFGAPPAFRSSPSVFQGFARIGGITAVEDGIFAADNRSGSPVLHFFDHSGNILESFPLPRLDEIEDIHAQSPQEIIITSRSAVYRFNSSDLSLRELHQAAENRNAQFISARLDDNDNLLVSDFRNSRVAFLSRLSGLYSGYHVEILRVESSDFPRIYAEVSVRDFTGNPVLGLDTNNFILTEDGLPLDGWDLEYSGSFDTHSSIALIMESSQAREDAEFRERQAEGLDQTLQAISSMDTSPSLRIVSAGLSPVLEYDRGDDPGNIPAILENLGADREWRLDQAIRLAGDRLLLDQSKRELVFIGRGNLPDWAFENIGLNQTLAYLRNNSIRLSFIQISDTPVDPALEYLLEQSGGRRYRLFQPRGLNDMAGDFEARRTGIYLFQSNSLFDADFGRKYLPIEVEVTHFTKSGRDESGYFAPLEF
ncbi:hypothetical protein [Salinispira pacifica]|uniref:6-bladed beta-propeller n=1 Tax=Salinispira pacifica TaxID=1307761 RepID=V5WG22_9SPIO|nr:hypothetical protein [Salinispira pacifica]AHC14787.1 hypothetical protein L21SP2_1388 [Salinispira pacifica]